MTGSRQYDLVVFGATGYTGKLTAEYIAVNLPTDLKWAIAGRSSEKLEAVAAECKTLNSDRIQPGIEISSLNDAELSALAKKTTLLISTVGPYSIFGEHAFKACAENGTHYLDVTGEVPFVAEMIQKYGKLAKLNKCIMIPQIGIESAPSDLVTFTLVDMIKKKFSAPTAGVVVSLHDIKGAPSGGTLASALGLIDKYGVKGVQEAHSPYSISPIPAPKVQDPTPWTTKIFGVIAVPDLGILTTSIGGIANIPIVHRSWGLFNGSYGPNFTYHEYMKSRNYLTAIAFHFALTIASLFLVVPSFRSIVQKKVNQPGYGQTKEQAKNDRVEYRGTATPDVQTPNTPRAFVRAHYEGDLYHFTGLLLGQAAISILRDKHDLPGDVYTPACLGQKFIDRVNDAGFMFEKKFFD